MVSSKHTPNMMFVATSALVALQTVVLVGGFQHVCTFGRPCLSSTASPMSSSSVQPLFASTRPLHMDVEGDSIDQLSQEKINRLLFAGKALPKSLKIKDNKTRSFLNEDISFDAQLQAAQTRHGMPWQDSIQQGKPLLYMPFWDWQMSFMKETLTNLEMVPMEERFEFIENKKKKARMFNLEFKSDEYRKIRMTYYDAGEGCQVFNSVWYPDAKYNLPVLGIDLLSFGGKKYLTIVDFQPIHESEEDHAFTFEDRLAPVKASYPSLKGKMSSKFYDETKFFSQEMLFARFEDVNVINDELYEAFQKYVTMHTDMVRECTPEDNSQSKKAVLGRHAAYDTYSAARDPATGLFAAMFGKEWADDFVYDFLFSLSERSEESTQNVTGPQRPQAPLKTQSKGTAPVQKGSMHISQASLDTKVKSGRPIVTAQAP